ncbi:MAG: hypothetical protein E6G03_02405 [Actinobacteria bacterium]|nr:MAG: hypothetical protein E6G03_02405 [Actinomycetota bacterium]
MCCRASTTPTSISRPGPSPSARFVWRTPPPWRRRSTESPRPRRTSSRTGGCAGWAGAAATGRPASSRRRRTSTASPATSRPPSWPGTTTRCGSTPRRSRTRTTTSRPLAASSSETSKASRRASCGRNAPGTSGTLTSRDGVRIANARGVTAVQDKDGWLGALGVWQRLRDEGSLQLRVWQSLPAEQVDELAALHIQSGFGDELVRVGYLKAFMDGTLGSQTARLLDGTGVEITSKEELVEYIRHGAAAGLPFAVHAIGDLANREALDAFEETASVWQPLGLRPRIEHAQLLAPEDVPRFAQLGVAASVQFSHAPSDRDLADRLWSGKTDGAYAYRSLWDSGALLANGSDAPIEELEPWAGVCAGVLRTLDEREAWHPEQRLTLEEALRATTVNPAWLARDEHRRGKLLPGFLADLVVLDRDPFELPPEELPDVQVVATMLGGRWTHNPPPWEDRRAG